jgi:hypothetical protein
MNIVDLIEELDGAGLVITDSDEFKEELTNMGVSLFATVEYNGEPENENSDDFLIPKLLD